MSTAAPLIELADVTVESPARERPLIEAVNWRIAPGDFWVVGGLFGTGKTALLETASGLRRPAAGEVRLFGDRAAALGGERLLAARRRIGFVYGEGGRLLGHFTLAQNLALPLCYHRNCSTEAVSREVDALIECFGLGAVAHHLPGQVNPAWRQRAALARALALQPQVLFLDNPLSGLNTRHARWWLDFLGAPEAQWSGAVPRPAALVVGTDDLRPWLEVGRQFAAIHERRWVLIGNREQLAAAREPAVRELLAEPPPPR